MDGCTPPSTIDLGHVTLTYRYMYRLCFYQNFFLCVDLDDKTLKTLKTLKTPKTLKTLKTLHLKP